MRYLVLASDYDGTLAEDGRVDEATLAALRRVRDSGRQLLLLTGRQLPELLELCPDHDVFNRIVAENGVLLYEPATRKERVLAEPAPAALIDTLRARDVEPLAVVPRDPRHGAPSRDRGAGGDPRPQPRMAGDLHTLFVQRPS